MKAMENSVKRFEDLNVRKESMQLAFDVYKLLKGCKDYGLRGQIQRSAVSVPSNIAEGYDRQTNKEFIRFYSLPKVPAPN